MCVYFLQIIPVKAVRIEAFNGGRIAVDGEVVDGQTVQAVMTSYRVPVMARLGEADSDK